MKAGMIRSLDKPEIDPSTLCFPALHFVIYML